MKPEGIHAAPWQLAEDGTWTILLSWQTGGAPPGGGRAGGTALPHPSSQAQQCSLPHPTPTPTHPAEPRHAPTPTPPEPYDPESVGSVVRYGDRPGALEREVVGTKRLVYRYVYGEQSGNTTYQVRPDSI